MTRSRSVRRAPAPIPGPVCYGLGGTQATLTDAFLTLGYINDVALAGGSFPLHADAGRAALARSDGVARSGLDLDARPRAAC